MPSSKPPRYSNRYLSRLSDKQPTFGAAEWNLFLPSAEKAYSLAVSATPWLLIEFVPGIQQITPLEDSEIGNISLATYNAATWLNSLVYGQDLRKDARDVDGQDLSKDAGCQPANVAFHSDEGGRPVSIPSITRALPSCRARSIGRSNGSNARRSQTSPNSRRSSWRTMCSSPPSFAQRATAAF